MATYSLSGSGTHALTASTTGLQVTITTPSSIGGLGRSNPVARYDQGLIRFSDGTSYWPPVAILGGPQFIPVPANATSMGYALLGGAVISVVEVIGGTVFFSAGASSLASLSDVTLASLADGQVLTWNAAAGKWDNTSPAVVSLSSASANLGADVVIAASTSTWSDVLSLTLSAGTWIVFAHATVRSDSAPTNFAARIYDGTTVYAAGGGTQQSTWWMPVSITSSPIVLDGSTTIKLQGFCDLAQVTFKRRAPNNNATGQDFATHMRAIKVA